MGSERAVDGRGQGQWKVVWMGSERAVDGQGEAVDGRWKGGPCSSPARLRRGRCAATNDRSGKAVTFALMEAVRTQDKGGVFAGTKGSRNTGQRRCLRRHEGQWEHRAEAVS